MTENIGDMSALGLSLDAGFPNSVCFTVLEGIFPGGYLITYDKQNTQNFTTSSA